LVPPLARHEWAIRISEFVLGYRLKPTTKFQHFSTSFESSSKFKVFIFGFRVVDACACLLIKKCKFIKHKNKLRRFSRYSKLKMKI
jgi:hypothetical protein